jgi:hypothetical protein
MAETDTKALTVAEKTLLGRCEAAIERNLAGVWELGHALTEIRDRDLWRGEYASFREYCLKRWQFSDRRARQMIEARETRDRLQAILTDESDKKSGTAVPLPENEWQTRELGKHPAEHHADIWATAQDLAGDGRPTAGDIARAAEQVVGEEEGAEPAEEPALQNRLGEDCEDWEVDFFYNKASRDEVRRLLGRALKLIGNLEEDPGMGAMNLPALKTVLNGFLLPHLRASEPYAGCKECEGAGCPKCFDHGFELRAAYTKTASEEPSEGEFNYLKAFEPKADPDMPRHEVKRRLNAHIAHKRLTKPTKKDAEG